MTYEIPYNQLKYLSLIEIFDIIFMIFICTNNNYKYMKRQTIWILIYLCFLRLLLNFSLHNLSYSNNELS